MLTSNIPAPSLRTLIGTTRPSSITKNFPEAFGFQFSDCTIEYISDSIIDAAQQKRKTRIAFVNAHCINEMYRMSIYNEAVRSADMVLADGSGIAVATLLESGVRCPNHNGTDLTPLLLKGAQERGLSVFFLGAHPGVAADAAKNLYQAFPGLKIAGTHHGYFSKDENDAVIKHINETNPDIVFVAFGVPKQDVWLEENSEKLDAPVTLGVGGLFDFLSGRIPRAPKFFRQTGLEWTYRLYQEPARMWRRYVLGNPIFLAHSVKSAFRRPFSAFRRKLDGAARRTIDMIGASLGLLLLSPVLAATAIAIRTESPGAAIFRQTRIGKNSTPFTMYKFRSMSDDAERSLQAMKIKNHHGENSVTFKIKKDPRVTKVGRIIRKFSIDELPQLWNVLVGDMSLVGPRPALPIEVAKYSKLATTLITGGTVAQITSFAINKISEGDRVVVFHDLPDNATSRLPKGTIVVFDVDPDGMNSDEVAKLFDARQIINFSGADEAVPTPQHLF